VSAAAGNSGALAIWLVAVLAATAGSVGAQEHAPAPLPHATPPGIRLSHSHNYPPHGTAVSAPPPSTVLINHPSGRYYYAGGVWYAPRGPHYVVVAAPVGVFVPVLPPAYTTVWVSGAPYYYANDTYYSWDAAQNGYEVVEPPAGQEGPPAAAADELFVYPQNGQSEQQTATDRYECHKWAALQSGLDPTQASGAANSSEPTADPPDYQRAMKACLEGRGYGVR
jgi:hypothetical protein